jgi:sec-independent protein translocase protein TatA
MGFTSIWHWIILILVVVLVFGQGKISELMGDVAKGIKSFKKGLAEDPEPAPPAQKTLELPGEPRPAQFDKESVGSGERRTG